MHASIRFSRRLVAAAVVPLVIALTGCAHEALRVEAQLAEILADQAAAWNRGDIEGFMDHYWKSDHLAFSAAGTTSYGWDATLERYRKRYPTPEQMGRLEFEVERIRPLGRRSALVLGRWRLQRDGESFGGNFSLIFQRIAGRWVIIHDHTSTDAQQGT